MIADILSEFDKLIYFDIDVVVTKDLSNLFHKYLGGNYIVGVRDMGVTDGYAKSIRIPSACQYINSGVLLMNLKQMRKPNF